MAQLRLAWWLAVLAVVAVGIALQRGGEVPEAPVAQGGNLRTGEIVSELQWPQRAAEPEEIVLPPPPRPIVPVSLPPAAPAVQDLPPPPPPPPPAPPPLSLQYLGSITLDEGRVLYQFLRNERVLALAPGAVLEDQYRFDGQDGGNLVFFYPPLAMRQYLPIPAK